MTRNYLEARSLTRAASCGAHVCTKYRKPCALLFFSIPSRHRPYRYFDQGRCICLDRLAQGGLKLAGICGFNPSCAIGLCQSDKIRVVQVRTDHMAVEGLLLGAFHIAVGVVVEDDHNGMDAVLYGGS